MTSTTEHETRGALCPSPSVSLTPEAIEALDALIERLISFRDLIDGDTEMEDDNQDRCEALDDAPRSDQDACNGYQAGGLPGDPDDAEDGGDTEDEGQTGWRKRVDWLRQRRRGKAVQS